MREAGDCVVMLVHEREKGDYVMPFVGQTQPDESRLVGKDKEKKLLPPIEKVSCIVFRSKGAPAKKWFHPVEDLWCEF
jgi:hypothetical protein